MICLSVNDAVLHGKPRSHVARRRDVLTLDFAVSIGGWVADRHDHRHRRRRRSRFAGQPVSDRLTRTALAAGIAAAVPGEPRRYLRPPSAPSPSTQAAVNAPVRQAGLGRTHAGTRIPSLGERGKGLPLKAGMTGDRTVVGARRNRLVVDLDITGRCAFGRRVDDRARTHTIAITADGPASSRTELNRACQTIGAMNLPTVARTFSGDRRPVSDAVPP